MYISVKLERWIQKGSDLHFQCNILNYREYYGCNLDIHQYRWPPKFVKYQKNYFQIFALCTYIFMGIPTW